ncbi:MAG: hypothetical protein ABI577_00815 [bacterium]
MKVSLLSLLVAGACVAACSGPGNERGSPTADSASVAASAATARETPSVPIPTPGLRDWTMGPPLDIGPGPDELDLELYIEQGCTGCDGPPTSLERVSRSASGELRREVLFSTPPGARYLTSTAAMNGQLWVTACFGTCAEVGNYIESGYSVLFASSDAGQTWAEARRSASTMKFWPGMLPGGQLILRTSAPAATEVRFEEFPSGNPLVAPIPLAFPIATANSTHPLVWGVSGEAGVWLPDGRQLDEQPLAEAALLFTLGNSLVRLPGDRKGPGDLVVIPQVWLSPDRALAWIDYAGVALMDFESKTVHRVSVYADSGGRTKVIGVKPK